MPRVNQRLPVTAACGAWPHRRPQASRYPVFAGWIAAIAGYTEAPISLNFLQLSERKKLRLGLVTSYFTR